jgi:dihydroorotate dehydrogenase
VPDWSYQTVFRPILFRLPAASAREFVFGFLGMLARGPVGPAVIDFLGHMGAPACLRREILGIDFPGPVGLGAGLDVRAVALPALARFGFGFLEIGPVTAAPLPPGKPIERRTTESAICYPEPLANPGLAVLLDRLTRLPRWRVPLGVRLGHRPGATAAEAARERELLIEQLAPHVAFFTLDPVNDATREAWTAAEWDEYMQAVRQAAEKAGRPLVVGVAPDFDPAHLVSWLRPVLAQGIQGVLISGGVATPEGRLVGLPTLERSLHLVRLLREQFGNGLTVIASGGVQEPQHALDLLQAGANLVQIHSGLVFSGPGLPKRINEALEAAALPRDPPEPAPPAVETTWLWLLLMGVGMLIGAVLALAIASTRVVLHYDEHFVGLSRDQLQAANPRLLAFLTHDRVTLAGTMISIAVLYVALAWYGMRHGLHWPRVTVLASAFSGFAGFFLFLGYGYFDPFHAFVAAVLFQLQLLGLHCRLPPRYGLPPPNLHNDWRWRLSLWGQLLLIVEAVGLLGAGLTIAGVGVTRVFVHEDLEFMHTTAGALQAVSPRLLPMIAHDRATFGGMLVSVGVAVLLTALWGFRQGQAWLWWALLGAGLSAYVPTLIVHFAVGYTDPGHLAPAFAGLFLFLAALALSYPYFCLGHSRTGMR